MYKRILRFSICLIIIINIVLNICCYDYDDVSKLKIVNSIGIDYNNNTNEYTVYYHLTNPSTLSTSELGGDSQTSSFMIAKATGKSLYEPISKINANANENISLYHISSIVFTDSYFTYKNLRDFILFINTNPKLFPNFSIFVTFDKLDDIYNLKALETTSTYYSLFAYLNSNSDYQFIKYNDLASYVCEKEMIISLPVLSSTKDIWKDETKNMTTLSIDGFYYLTHDERKLYIKKDEFKIVNSFINNKNILFIYDDFTLDITKYVYKIIYHKNKFIIKISAIIYVNRIIDTDHKSIKSIINEQIINEYKLLLDYINSNDFDVFNLKDKLYRHKKNNLDYKTIPIVYEIDTTIY